LFDQEFSLITLNTNKNGYKYQNPCNKIKIIKSDTKYIYLRGMGGDLRSTSLLLRTTPLKNNKNKNYKIDENNRKKNININKNVSK
jgi:hypothetical protein